MKRLGLTCLVCLCCWVVPSGVAQASQPPPRASAATLPGDIATGFAFQIASHGAGYLVQKLQDGALGSTGVSIGNFLSDIGLGSKQDTAVQEELKVLNERMGKLQQDVVDVNNKLEKLGATVSNGNYAILVAFANKLRSAVLTGDRKLREIAATPPGAERRALAAEFADFYRRELKDKELEFENYLTGGGVSGADGILQLASRKARSAAQPFFTYPMSQFPRQVLADYGLVQAVWLEERLNYMHYENRTPAQLQAAINETKAALEHEHLALPQVLLFHNNVIDTRTGLMWTWRVSPGECVKYDHEYAKIQGEIDALLVLRKRPPDFQTRLTELRAKLREANSQGNLCIYARGPDAAPGVWDLNRDFATVYPSQGSPSAGWKRPTVDQIKALDTGATGGVPAWLHARGEFPQKLTGEVWTSEKSGNSAKTYNQSTGAVNTRNLDEQHFSLLQGLAVDNWYWVGQ
jgi:hypothetical protein